MKVIPNSQIRKTIGKGRKFQFCTDCLQQHPTDLDNNRTPQKIHLPFIVPAPTTQSQWLEICSGVMVFCYRKNSSSDRVKLL